VSQIDVLGARQAVPAAVPKPSLPEDLKGDAGDYAFDPADDRMTIGFGGGDDRPRRDSTQDSTRHRDVEFRHPLAPGSEADYRFASGDSSVIVFPDGRTIRLRELKVMPRRLHRAHPQRYGRADREQRAAAAVRRRGRYADRGR